MLYKIYYRILGRLTQDGFENAILLQIQNHHTWNYFYEIVSAVISEMRDFQYTYHIITLLIKNTYNSTPSGQNMGLKILPLVANIVNIFSDW